MTTCTLKLTRSQQMALVSLISEYMCVQGGDEEFYDCSVDPPVRTTTWDLLNLAMTAPYHDDLPSMLSD